LIWSLFIFIKRSLLLILAASISRSLNVKFFCFLFELKRLLISIISFLICSLWFSRFLILVDCATAEKVCKSAKKRIVILIFFKELKIYWGLNTPQYVKILITSSTTKPARSSFWMVYFLSRMPDNFFMFWNY